VDTVHEEYRAYGRRLAAEDMTIDASAYLAERQQAGDSILLEGAQGTSLDIDHGGYPFVTSSNPTAGYAATGSGLPPTAVGSGAVVGVVKAYLSRVGAGPMPTELDGDLAETIRERGGEYGTVTGRPRRVGWLDLPMLRHATRVSGFTDLALNHLDVLSALDELRVAVAYERGGERVETLPATDAGWENAEPVYREFEPWETADWEVVAAEGYDALPAAARTYVEFLEDDLGVPVTLLGVGPSRSATIVREHPLET
jgi:adenylosuccinate synthase